MADLFSDGHLVDFVLVVVGLEAAVLLSYWQRTRRGIAPPDLLPNLCAGVFLLLALRSALAGHGWVMGSTFLAAAGLAHVIDVYRRWRR